MSQDNLSYTSSAEDLAIADFSLFDPASSGPADGCTQCSVCLDSCPTFKITGDPDQSPMGRIRLLRKDAKTWTEAETQALASCLHCYQCVDRCPSNVPYRDMINDANVQAARGFLPQLFLRLVQFYNLHPGLQSAFARRVAPLASVLIRLLPGAPALARALTRRASGHAKENPSGNDKENTQQEVLLFEGCMAEIADKNALSATIDILNRCGINVRTKANLCCGALPLHSGQPDISDTAATELGKSIHQHPDTKIVMLNNACVDHTRYANTSEPEIDRKVVSIITLLHELDCQFDSALLPEYQSVLLHIPCSSNENETNQLNLLLQKVSGLKISILKSDYGCCGAGGIHSITHAELADSARKPLIEQIRSQKADCIISTNIGCALHIESGLIESGLDMPVLHPVELLSMAMTSTGQQRETH